MKRAICTLMVLTLVATPALADDTRSKLTEAVTAAKAKAKEGLRAIGGIAQDLGTEKSALPGIKKRMSENPKDYAIQIEYIDAMLEVVKETKPGLVSLKAKIDEQTPEKHIAKAVTGLEELAAYCDSRSAEAQRNVESAERQHDKERYASCAESLARAARAYRSDKEKWEKNKTDTEAKFKGIASEIEYCDFLEETLETIRDALQIVQDGEEFAEEIAKLGAQLDRVTQDLAEFSTTIVLDDN